MVTIRRHTLGFTLTRACPPCEASKEAGEDGAEEREGEEEQEAGHQQGGQQVHCQEILCSRTVAPAHPIV